jgi:hypothetical protein
MAESRRSGLAELNTPEGKPAALTAEVLENAGKIEVEVPGRSLNRGVITIEMAGTSRRFTKLGTASPAMADPPPDRPGVPPWQTRRPTVHGRGGTPGSPAHPTSCIFLRFGTAMASIVEAI